ncbi:AsnC family protein [Streptomyces sp. TRM64462]|uniref:AsnC family protein n=1 Tax=Streptomyces sp. TRM64462 TaxID=2741726 RepID=UPI00158619BD|nr:AsnC family protein [Streptomyces sp. TRM64462]
MGVAERRTDADRLLRLRNELLDAPVEYVPVAALKVVESPRHTVEDPGHCRTLAEIGDMGETLPPVVVHRASMTVVDGIHRLRAARLRGRDTIPVRFFDGSAEDGRLLAVALNVTHGLPLTMAERTAAVARILAVHPEWSDRAVASVAGLSAGKTAEIRRGLFGTARPGAKRVGRDGRARPLEPARGRERAAALLRENPTASLRRIAREAGVSPATVADVRRRMTSGDGGTASGGTGADGTATGGGRSPEAAATVTAAVTATATATATVTAAAVRQEPPDLAEIHSMLRRDPALRFNETGRSFLRLLEAGAALSRHREGIAASLPPHCREAAARLAQVYAQSWELFAKELQ